MMSMRRGLICAWLTTLILLATLGSPAGAQAVHTLTIAAPATIVDGQAHYGGEAHQRVIDEGWLASQLRAHGVELHWMPVSGDVGSTINEAFASQRIEFAGYGDLPSIILNASGTRTQAVVPYGRGLDTFLLVPTGSTARSLADLKGKRIAVHRGRPWYLSFLRLLEQSGLKPGDFTLVNMDIQPSIAALVGGNIDALFTISSYTVTDKGLGKIIWSSKGQVDKKIRVELWGARSFIDSHPDLTQLVTTAYVRAQYWQAQEQNRAAVIKEATASGRSLRAVEESFDDNTLAWKDFSTPIIDAPVLDHYRDAIAFAADKHLIRSPLRAEDLFQTKFVSAALVELQLEHFWSQRPVVLRATDLAARN